MKIENVFQSFRVGFWLKKKEILNNISFSVPRGSIFGFLGANGAGKTTLIQIIVGIRKAISGNVNVCGFPAMERKAKEKIGYLPERPYFYEHLTGDSLLRYFGALSGMRKPEIERRIPKVLDAVGIGHARHVFLRAYSKGMLQRIGIAQAILHDSELLILDEPMSGLDPLGRKEIRELMLKLSSEGRTVFFSSHIIPDVEAICDQVAIIRKGQLLSAGPIGTFLNAQTGVLPIEVGFSGITIEAAMNLGRVKNIRQVPDAICVTVEGQDDSNEFVKKLMENKAKILWMQPIRPTLESLFDKDFEMKRDIA